MSFIECAYINSIVFCNYSELKQLENGRSSNSVFIYAARYT